MKGRAAFTLIEVLVAMGVLSLISMGVLATSWKLTGIARDYVEYTIADAYCHDVIYAATASTNKFGYAWSKDLAFSWQIDPSMTNLCELPRIDTVDLFNHKSTVYPLWRNQDTNHFPVCTITYPSPTNIRVSVVWDWSSKRSIYAKTNVVEGACR